MIILFTHFSSFILHYKLRISNSCDMYRFHNLCVRTFKCNHQWFVGCYPFLSFSLSVDKLRNGLRVKKKRLKKVSDKPLLNRAGKKRRQEKHRIMFMSSSVSFKSEAPYSIDHFCVILCVPVSVHWYRPTRRVH